MATDMRWRRNWKDPCSPVASLRWRPRSWRKWWASGSSTPDVSTATGTKWWLTFRCAWIAFPLVPVLFIGTYGTAYFLLLYLKQYVETLAKIHETESSRMPWLHWESCWDGLCISCSSSVNHSHVVAIQDARITFPVAFLWRPTYWWWLWLTHFRAMGSSI